MIVMSPAGDDHSHEEIVALLKRIITLLEDPPKRRASPNGSGPPMGADELGALLKHTPDWVRAACRAGRLPHQKIGKLYVFTPDDVAEILAATAVKVRSEPTPPARVGSRRRTRTFYRPG
jgi:hypothetical protein